MKRILLLCFFSLSVIFSSYSAVWTVNTNSDANTGAANAGTLRWCLEQICNAGGTHSITFAASYTITLNSALNTYNSPNVTIDAGTNTIIIRGTNNGIDGLPVNANSGSYIIKGIIFQYLKNAIVYNNGAGLTVQGCKFGVDVTGTSKSGNEIAEAGILVQNGNSILIGGPNAADGNLISGCVTKNTGGATKMGAITIKNGNSSGTGITIQNNIIGLDITGTSKTGIGNGTSEPLNQHGIYTEGNISNSARPLLIDRNIISNNVGNGIWVNGSTQNIIVTGNKIGTDITGMNPMGNMAAGLRIDGGSNHFIGVDATGSVGVSNANRNIISGNGGAPDVRNCRNNAFNSSVGCGAQYLTGCNPTSNCPDKYDGTLQTGIYLFNVNSTTIANNFVGTDITGNTTSYASGLVPYNGLGNLYAGIKIEGSSSGNIIGGASGKGNIVGGNGFDPFVTSGVTTPYLGHGIQLNNHTVVNTTISYNNVGIGFDGISNIGNRQDGISLLGAQTNTTISNNLSGYNAWGIFLQSDFGGTGQLNQVSGVTISLNILKNNGNRPAPLSDGDGGGIGVQHGSYSNTITGNQVTNNRNGIVLRNSGNGGAPYKNTITANVVTTNDVVGILISQGSGSNSLDGGNGANIIGGVGVGNTVSNNGTYGIELDSAQSNKILANTINANGADGIGIHNGSKNNIIGGASTEANQITNNAGNGIQIKNPNAAGSSGNAFNRNSISCNALRGIELNSLGNAGFANPTFTGTPTNFSVTHIGGASVWIEIYTLDGCNDCGTSITNNKLQGKTLVAEGFVGSAAVTNINPATYGKSTNLDFTATASSAAPSTTNGATTAHNTSEFATCQQLCVAATPVISGNSPVCDGTTGIVYSIPNNSGSTYAWTVPTGFSVTNGSGTSSITVTVAAGAATGTIKVTETKSTGCPYPATLSVTVNARPTVSASTTTPTVCAGVAAPLSVSVSGPAGPYTYAWAANSNLSATNIANPTATTSTAGSSTYSVTVTAANNCSNATPATVSVTVNARPTVSASTTTPTVCTGVAAPLSVSVSGPAGPYTYAWAANSNLSATNIANPTATASTAGTTTYSVTVTAANNCSNATPATVSVTVNARPTVSASTTTPTVCSGVAAPLSVSVSGPAGPYTYAWTANSNLSATNIANPTATTSTAGTTTYSVTVTAANNCSNATPATVSVTVNDRPTVSASTTTPTVCTGVAAPLAVSVSGASGPYTYAWAANSNLSATNIDNPTATSSTAGTTTYSVTVTAANNCSNSTPATVSVTVNARPTVSANTTTPTVCTGVAAPLNVSVSGPAGPYTYAWTANSDLSATNIANPTATSSSAGTHTYSVTVTAANNCSNATPATVSVTVNDRPTVTASTLTPTVCLNIPAQLNVSVSGPAGPYTYAWAASSDLSATNISNPTATSGSLGSHIYSVTVTAANNCSNATPATVTVNVAPSLQPQIVGTLTPCENTNAVVYSVNGNSGSTFTWSSTGGVNITSGTSGSQITVNVGSTNGTITVKETASTCSGSTTVNINKLTRPADPVLSGPASICAPTNGVNFNVTNDASGSGVTYQWSIVSGTGSTLQTSTGAAILVNVATAATAGSIKVVATASNGCTDLTDGSASYAINNRPADPVAAGPASICAPSSGVNFSVSNDASGTGVTYAWVVASGTGATLQSATGAAIKADISNSATAGSIKVTATASNGCTSTNDGVASYSIGTRPTDPIIAGPAAVCIPNSGVAFTISNSVSGVTYSWAVTAGTGVTLQGTTGDAVSADFSTTATTGSIKVTATDPSGCTNENDGTASFAVNSRPTPSANVSGNGSFCNGTEADLTASATNGDGNYTYSWTPATGLDDANSPTPKASVTGTTTYSVSVTDGNNCASLTSASVTITMLPSTPKSFVVSDDRAICVGSVDIHGSKPGIGFTGEWSSKPAGVTFTSTSDSITVADNFAAGSTWLYWTVTGPCSASKDSMEVTLKTFSFDVKIQSSNDTLCLSSGVARSFTATINGSSAAPYTYHWTSSDNSFNANAQANPISIAPVNPGWTFYYLQVEDADNCVSGVEKDSVYAIGEQALVIPNLMTPNDDHHNDCFLIRYASGYDILPGSVFNVYNRWGQAVYRNNSYKNGDFCGSVLADGIYYYHLEAGCGHKEQKGWLQIIGNADSSSNR